MRDDSNKKIVIILSVLVLLCVLVFYRVVKHYSNKEINPTIITVVNDENNLADQNNNEEISLGDGGCSIISASTNKKKVSPGDLLGINIRTSGCANRKYTVSGSNITSASGTIGSNNYVHVTVTAKSACGSLTYTVTVSGGGSRSGSVAVDGNWPDKGSPITCTHFDGLVCENISCANKNGLSVYYGGKCTTADGKQGYSLRYSRGCDNGGGGGTTVEEPPPPPPPACYGNERFISIATSVIWSSYPDSAHPHLISSVGSEDACKIVTQPSFCVPSNFTSAKTTEKTSTCEDKIDIKTTDGLKCSGNAPYNITCTNKTTTRFDLDDDGNFTKTTRNLLVGQGFKYSIKVTTKRECKARFYDGTWKAAYSKANDVIKMCKADLNRSPNASEKDKLERKIEVAKSKQADLREMVTKYRSFEPNKIFDEKSDISLTYKVDNTGTTLNTTLVATTLQESVGKYSNREKVNLNVSGVTNPYNYDWDNNSTPNIVKLNAPKRYIDTETGMKVSEEPQEGYLDGGNKIYIDYYTTPGIYTLNIKVTGIGGNGTINNNKCNIKVSDQEILYRPIDVSNPFINNEWKPGKNWINSKFDFRNIIHDDIWN